MASCGFGGFGGFNYRSFAGARGRNDPEEGSANPLKPPNPQRTLYGHTRGPGVALAGARSVAVLRPARRERAESVPARRVAPTCWRLGADT